MRKKPDASSLSGERAVGVSLDETTTNRDSNCDVDLSRHACRDWPMMISGSPRCAFQNSGPQFGLPSHRFFTCARHRDRDACANLKKSSRVTSSLCHSMIPLARARCITECERGNVSDFVAGIRQAPSVRRPAPHDQTIGKKATSRYASNGRVAGGNHRFAAISLQPNAGSQGEYAGLLAIREYHASRRSASQCLV